MPLPSKTHPINTLARKQILVWAMIIAIATPAGITLAAMLIVSIALLLGRHFRQAPRAEEMHMNNLSHSSRAAATDLRRAERSITQATRDAAQFLVTTLDITQAHSFSPIIAHGTVRATVGALSALVESQHHLAFRAHLSIEKAGTDLGLTVTDWVVGDPKQASAVEAEVIAA